MVDSVIARWGEGHRVIEPPMTPTCTRPDEEPPARLCRMVSEHFDSVYRAVKRFGAPASLVEDGAQQVFLVAASKLDAIERVSERSFLLGTAFRIAKELRRRAADVPKTDLAEKALLAKVDSSPDLDEVLDRKRARLVLDDLLAEMPDDLRAVFVLYEVEGLTVPEISEALDVAVGTASSRLRRARESFEQGIARHQARSRFRSERAHDLSLLCPTNELRRRGT